MDISTPKKAHTIIYLVSRFEESYIMYSNLASWKSSFSWDAAAIFSKSVSSFHAADVTKEKQH